MKYQNQHILSNNTELYTATVLGTHQRLTDGKISRNKIKES